MHFTESQRAAIQHRDGHLQLIACAGSGKTEVIAQHIAARLDSACGPSLAPENVIAITFTERAASELRERIALRVRARLGRVPTLGRLFVGTLHGFALDLLQTEIPALKSYRVLSGVQQVLLVERHAETSGLLDARDLEGDYLDPRRDAGRYLAAVEILREASVRHDRLAETGLLDCLARYRALLDAQRCLDYTAMLERAAELIEHDSAVRERLSARLRLVVVDEYQDLNPLQERLVAALAALGATLCIVGDDDQTLYGWRGADVRNILTFAERYPGVRQLRLEENFRSSRGVVGLARDLIALNRERLPKAMESTDAQPFEQGDIEVLAFLDHDAEAGFIARKLRELHGLAFTEREVTRGIAWSDMAILLRSVRANGDPITQALDLARIPYVVTGMKSLFETREARAGRDLFLFLTGHGDVDASALYDRWQRVDLGVAEERIRAAIDALGEHRDALGYANSPGAGAFSLQSIYREFLAAIGLREERVPEQRGEAVLYNLGKFSQVIADFEAIHYDTDAVERCEVFAKFLVDEAEDAYPEGTHENSLANPDAVRVMTIHQAKGMQWPVVFVPALLHNRFPAPRMGGLGPWHVVPRTAVANQERYEGSLDDERRLLYVAVTRAQRFLCLTCGPVPGKNSRYARPSVFWEEALASPWVARRDVGVEHRQRADAVSRSEVPKLSFARRDLEILLACPYQFKLRVLYGFRTEELPVDDAQPVDLHAVDEAPTAHTVGLREAREMLRAGVFPPRPEPSRCAACVNAGLCSERR